VPRRFVLKGTRATPIDPSLHIWLFVRAEVEGSHWYPYPKEIVARPDGAWEAELDLGGPASIRHELRLGVLGGSTRAALLRQIAEHPNAPLEELPRGFTEEAQLSVVRQ